MNPNDFVICPVSKTKLDDYYEPLPSETVEEQEIR